MIRLIKRASRVDVHRVGSEYYILMLIPKIGSVYLISQRSRVRDMACNEWTQPRSEKSVPLHLDGATTRIPQSKTLLQLLIDDLIEMSSFIRGRYK